MTRDNLNELLNITYELEGLTVLALNGKQDMARLRELMQSKARTICEICAQLDMPQDVAESETAGARGGYPAESPFSEPAETKTVRMPVDTPAAAPVGAPAPAAAPATVKPKPAPAVPPKSASRPAPVGAPAPEKARVIFPDGNQAAPTPASEHRPLNKMFPINEWFLFRRELFGNSDDDFKASLSVVEEGGNFNRAEMYFYNDLQWNREDPNVKAFMEIVRNYFRQ